MNGLYLIARIGGRPIAFAADAIDSVVDVGTITPVPRAMPGIVGIAALRSRVVTVIDPRVALGLSVGEPGARRRAVVGKVDGHLYAIQVDGLEDIGEYPVTPLPTGVVLGTGWAGVGDLVVEYADGPVLVATMERLIPDAESLAA